MCADFTECYFGGAGLLVFLAWPVNHLAQSHWKSFATQNSFDQHGAFITLIYSCPLILISLVGLVRVTLHLWWNVYVLGFDRVRDGFFADSNEAVGV